MSPPEKAAALGEALQPITSRVRTGATAIKVDDGTSRWRPDEALTTARLTDHVSGGVARGVCPIKEGETTT
ncbi:MAG: hypothetical protein EOO27_45995, partial [Comamonadaceae bacterium]